MKDFELTTDNNLGDEYNFLFGCENTGTVEYFHHDKKWETKESGLLDGFLSNDPPFF